MSVTVVKSKKPKILCGIIFPSFVCELYEAIPNREHAEEIIKEDLGIDKRRLIKLIQPYTGDTPITMLVIYDTLIKENERYKYLEKLEIPNFNFNIYEYNRDFIRDLEVILNNLKKE